MPEEDEFEVSVKASERRECPHCRQETTWNLVDVVSQKVRLLRTPIDSLLLG